MARIEDTDHFKAQMERRSKYLTLIHHATEKHGLSHEDILNMLADAWGDLEERDQEIKELVALVNDSNEALHIFSGRRTDGIFEKSNSLILELLATELDNKTAKELLKGAGLQKSFAASQSGKAGAIKRHAPNTKLREWAVDKFKMLKSQAIESGRKPPSANKVAFDLKGAAMDYGRTVGFVLSEENAQRTLADWFRKYG